MEQAMFQPYQLAGLRVTTSTRRRVVEVVSQPTPDETIMVRMVPGEPTTVAEVKIEDLIPHQRKKWVHIAQVRTGFCFPEDMLRLRVN